ncbi:MAG: SurA N-terminal domain-containing protein [Candidatus Levybacteria bacterium]|nr:SurA N-terminal domain-containing protein [Candidatus Levybacteria bacterium]
MPVKKSAKSKTKLSTIQETAMSKSVDVYPIVEKLKQPKVFIGLIVVILAVGVFFLKGLFIAALVNGEPITRLSVIRGLEKQGGKQALASSVNQVLIFQEAKKKNIEVSQEEVDKSVKQIEDSLKKQGQNLDTALAAQGMTRQDFLMQLKLRNLVEKLLADKIKVSDKEIADYTEKNKESFPAEMKEDEIKKGVQQQLQQQKLATVSQEWLAGLEKNAKINYFISY